MGQTWAKLDISLRVQVWSKESQRAAPTRGLERPSWGNSEAGPLGMSRAGPYWVGYESLSPQPKEKVLQTINMRTFAAQMHLCFTQPTPLSQHLLPTLLPLPIPSLLFFLILPKTNCLSHQPAPGASERFLHETNYAPLIWKLAAFPLTFI